MKYLNDISIKADNKDLLSKKLIDIIKNIKINLADEFIQVIYRDNYINIYIHDCSKIDTNSYWAYNIEIETKNKRGNQNLIHCIFHELGFFLSNSERGYSDYFVSTKIFDTFFTKSKAFEFQEKGFSFCKNNFAISCYPTESELIACGIDEKIVKKIKYEKTCKRILLRKERIDKALKWSLLYKERYEKSKVAYQNDINSLSDEEKIYLQLKGITL